MAVMVKAIVALNSPLELSLLSMITIFQFRTLQNHRGNSNHPITDTKYTPIHATRVVVPKGDAQLPKQMVLLFYDGFELKAREGFV